MTLNNKPDDDISDENDKIMDFTCYYIITYFNILYSCFNVTNNKLFNK